MKKFLDFYTKGIENDWEKTPQARISVLRYNQPPIKYVPFDNWPVPNTALTKFYLSDDSTLHHELSSVVAGKFSYQSDVVTQQLDADPEELSFTVTFTERTTLIGRSKAVLYMSCPDHDDMDIFVMIRKADVNGTVLRNINIPLTDLNAVDPEIKQEKDVNLVNTHQFLGPMGVLRASHRKLDVKASTEQWGVHDHSSEDKIAPGTFVKLEIGIWPAAMQFEAGEKMVLRVSGHNMRLPDYAALAGAGVTGNNGRHVLHVGGEFASYLEVPFVGGI